MSILSRRTAVAALASLAGQRAASGAGAERLVRADPMSFAWRHDQAHLIGALTAPTAGWIAVGFNAAADLAGTIFVMAHVAGASPRVELHRARVPDHVKIALASAADLTIEDAAHARGESRLRFRLAHAACAALGAPIDAGAATHLMLAFSDSADFEHHSAFRIHRNVVL